MFCRKKRCACFEKYNQPQTLAVCADGLEQYPSWVDHINNNKHRYNIQLHANVHQNYKHMTLGEVEDDLRRAIWAIEDTFGTRIETWYPPFGRKGEHEDRDEICRRLGITCYRQVGKVDAKFWLKNPDKSPHINFHYWTRNQVKIVEEICHRLHEQN